MLKREFGLSESNCVKLQPLLCGGIWSQFTGFECGWLKWQAGLKVTALRSGLVGESAALPGFDCN